MYNKDNLVLKAESFVERRKLFKNIWDAAMELDEKDGDNKPKVIRTLKMEDVDRTAARRKKQRISNLRQVCTKILDFCDKQEAEDMITEQVTVANIGVASSPETDTVKHKNVKSRKRKIKKRLIRNTLGANDMSSGEEEFDENQTGKTHTASFGRTPAKKTTRNNKVIKKPSKKASQTKPRKVSQTQRNSLSAPHGPAQSTLKSNVKRNSR